MYPVGNDLGWERDPIELCCLSDNMAFKKMYVNRAKLEATFYNMDHCNYGDPLSQYGIYNADDFETDYNDELYDEDDCGYWIRVFHCDEDFVKKVVTCYK